MHNKWKAHKHNEHNDERNTHPGGEYYFVSPSGVYILICTIDMNVGIDRDDSSITNVQRDMQQTRFQNDTTGQPRHVNISAGHQLRPNAPHATDAMRRHHLTYSRIVNLYGLDYFIRL